MPPRIALVIHRDINILTGAKATLDNNASKLCNVAWERKAQGQDCTTL